MREMIAGRILRDMKDEDGKEVQRTAAEVMAEVIFEGMQGKLVLSKTEKGITYANPLHAVKLYQEYMLRAKELWIRVAELKKKEQGSSGGIRVILPSPIVDPLLRPGQPPRPLRLLGQDPSKPIHGSEPKDHEGGHDRGEPGTVARNTEPARTGESPARPTQPPGRQGPNQGPSTASRQPRSAPPRHPPAEEKFDAAEIMEDFEHPICQICMGAGMVRNENGINMVTCDYCEGEGRAPAPR